VPNVNAEHITPLLSSIDGSELNQRFAQLMLLFGTRIGETRLAQWDHIDFDNRIWRIPGTLTKTREEHSLPLTDLAVAILFQVKQIHQESGYSGRFLFPANSQRCWNENDANKAVQQVSGRNWTARDLRNLARTVWEQLTGKYAIGELLLNHSLGKMADTYIDKKALWESKTSVLNIYHQWIIANDSSGNVAQTITRCEFLENNRTTNDLAA
jgi:integrase